MTDVPDTPPPDPRAEVIYRESVRALDLQSASVDELRARTGVLLAAASVATAFLGAEAFKLHGFWWVNVLAAIVFVGVVLLALFILMPKGGWEFTYNADVLQQYYLTEKKATLTQMYLSMATGHAESRLSNKKLLDCRMEVFAYACGALGLDVVLWLIGIRA